MIDVVVLEIIKFESVNRRADGRRLDYSGELMTCKAVIEVLFISLKMAAIYRYTPIDEYMKRRLIS